MSDSQDEVWYTKRPCAKCGTPVILDALWTLMNLDQLVYCEECRKEDANGQDTD